MRHIRYNRNIPPRNDPPMGVRASEIYNSIDNETMVMIYDHERGNVISEMAHLGHFTAWAMYELRENIDERHWDDKYARGYWLPNMGTLALYMGSGPTVVPDYEVYRHIAEEMGIDPEEVDALVVIE